MTVVETPGGQRYRLSLFDLGLACCAVEFVAASVAGRLPEQAPLASSATADALTSLPALTLV